MAWPSLEGKKECWCCNSASDTLTTFFSLKASFCTSIKMSILQQKHQEKEKNVEENLNKIQQLGDKGSKLLKRFISLFIKRELAAYLGQS